MALINFCGCTNKDQIEVLLLSISEDALKKSLKKMQIKLQEWIEFLQNSSLPITWNGKSVGKTSVLPEEHKQSQSHYLREAQGSI